MAYHWIAGVDVGLLVREKEFEDVGVSAGGGHQKRVDALVVGLVDLGALAHQERHAVKVTVARGKGECGDALGVDVARLLQSELEPVDVAHRAVLHEQRLLQLPSLLLLLLLLLGLREPVLSALQLHVQLAARAIATQPD